MASRITGASLGLLAFSISIATGLLARNQPGVILTRAITAMIVFCLIGLAAGAAVSMVVREHVRNREAELEQSMQKAQADLETKKSSTGDNAEPMDT